VLLFYDIIIMTTKLTDCNCLASIVGLRSNSAKGIGPMLNMRNLNKVGFSNLCFCRVVSAKASQLQ